MAAKPVMDAAWIFRQRRAWSARERSVENFHPEREIFSFFFMRTLLLGPGLFRRRGACAQFSPGTPWPGE